MSHAVMRGDATKAQLYLDEVLRGVEAKGEAARGGGGRPGFGELVYWCMRDRPELLRMINGGLDEYVTNEELLGRSVRAARALGGARAAGDLVCCVATNHKDFIALYFGAIFTGVVPLLLDPMSTALELKHFIDLIEPVAIFSDEDKYGEVAKALESNKKIPVVVFANESDGDFTTFSNFVKQYSADVESFRPARRAGDAAAVLLPSSGSTGLPKATIITQRGLLAHLPSLWSYHERFPQPVDRALLVSSAQWMTYTTLMFSAAVYHITVVLTSKKSTPMHVIEIIDKYQTDWALLNPVAAAGAALAADSPRLRSLRTLLLTGSAPAQTVIAAFKEKLPARAHLHNGYGMTEAEGFVAVPAPASPPASVGKPLNIFLYKIIDDEGKELGPLQKGELCIKSDHCITKGYYKNESIFRECFTAAGWLHTGDLVYVDHDEQLHFVERKKLWFKYNNYHVSPEELEGVIRGVEGVVQAVVAEAPAGPAALVVLAPARRGDDRDVRARIHRAVDSALSDYKRLRGGVALVPRLPATRSGKLHRGHCRELLHQLIQQNECF